MVAETVTVMEKHGGQESVHLLQDVVVAKVHNPKYLKFLQRLFLTQQY